MKVAGPRALTFVVVLAACQAQRASSEPASSGDAGAPLDDASSTSDPFAPQSDEGAGLTDVSADLQALLENGALPGACDSYRSGQTDRKTTLLCGKWMFFYETFGTSGIPTALVEFLASSFPVELGLGFSKLGMTPDPGATGHLPLGMAATTPLAGNVPAVAFTCASCHFSRLSDGRYAVGAPNLHYDYARHILTISLAPTLALGLTQPSTQDPAAVAEVQPVLDRLASDANLRLQLESTLLPLASLKLPAMTPTIEHEYATWPTGTLDFLIAPLPIDDHVHVVGKMIGLWGIPRPEEAASAGMANVGVPSGLLGWTGDTHTLTEFLRGFAILGGAATTPTEADMSPLMEYLYSLRAPPNPNPPDAAMVSAGAALFREKGCSACHDGPRGSGKRVYALAEIGTDPAVSRWADPDLTGLACCGVPTPAGGLTHGVKSPRLVGAWTIDRWLHDGALASLDELFCRGAGRPAAGVEPLRTDGHAFTCDGLTEDDKSALVAYLLSH